MIAHVYIVSYHLGKEDKVSPEAYTILRRICPNMNEDQEKNYHDFSATIDLEEFFRLDINPENVKITPVKRLSIPDSKMEELRNAGTPTEVIKAVNTVNVMLPSSELSSFTNVAWLENYCTEQLQKELDDGWRILAILPQPNHRRPDYILGRGK